MIHPAAAAPPPLPPPREARGGGGEACVGVVWCVRWLRRKNTKGKEKKPLTDPNRNLLRKETRAPRPTPSPAYLCARLPACSPTALTCLCASLPSLPLPPRLSAGPLARQEPLPFLCGQGPGCRATGGPPPDPCCSRAPASLGSGRGRAYQAAGLQLQRREGDHARAGYVLCPCLCLSVCLSEQAYGAGGRRAGRRLRDRRCVFYSIYFILKSQSKIK